jgi:bifunctional non-homologous end joining protein LigD
MLPHLADRPRNLERYPDGIEGRRIIQQRAGKHFPSWIKRVRVPKGWWLRRAPCRRRRRTLVYLADQACIALHRRLSRADRLERPRRLIPDLDPGNGQPADVRRGARVVGELLHEPGLEPWVMSTGSRRYHVAVPLRRDSEFDTVRAVAQGVATLAVARAPRLFTTEQRKARRQGRT